MDYFSKAVVPMLPRMLERVGKRSSREAALRKRRDACAKAAGIFRALGDTSRLELLALLAEGDLCVTEIADRLGDNLSAVSQRLRLLRSERIVKQRREGKHVYYSLADEHVTELIANALAHAEE